MLLEESVPASSPITTPASSNATPSKRPPRPTPPHLALEIRGLARRDERAERVAFVANCDRIAAEIEPKLAVSRATSVTITAPIGESPFVHDGWGDRFSDLVQTAIAADPSRVSAELRTSLVEHVTAPPAATVDVERDARALRAIERVVAAAQSGDDETIARASEDAQVATAALFGDEPAIAVRLLGTVVAIGARVAELPHAATVGAMVLREVLAKKAGNEIAIARDATAEDWRIFARRLVPAKKAPPPLPHARVKGREADPIFLDRVHQSRALVPQQVTARLYAASVAIARALVDASDRGEIGVLDDLEAIADGVAALDRSALGSLIAATEDTRGDRACKLVRAAMLAVWFGRSVREDEPLTLRQMAAAAMLQELCRNHRDPGEAALRLLTFSKLDPSTIPEVVVAWESIAIRADEEARVSRAPTLQARLLALSVEDARPSVVEAVRPSQIEIHVALEEPHRPSIELPPAASADGCGSLVHSGLPQILASACARGLTGSLLLTDPGDKRHVVVFEHGVPVKARTKHAVRPIGETLVDFGWLPSHELGPALARAAAAHRRLGEQLLEDRLIGEARLRSALRAQLLARVGALATSCPETRFEFFVGRDLLPSEPPCPVPAAAAVLAAARCCPQVARMENALHRLGDDPLVVELSEIERLVPLDAEREVLLTVRRYGVSWRALVGGKLVDREVARPFLYALLVLGHLATDAYEEAPSSKPRKRRSEIEGR